MNIPGTLPEGLALLCACLNALSAVLVLLAYRAIRGRAVARHRRLMISAVSVSALFLASYLTRYALAGDTPFQGTGWLRPLYFSILISHVALAIVIVPLVLRSLYLGLKKRFDAHPRIARVTYPLWLYVSVTGVLVYLMLYQFPG